ncbi:MAG TPA: cation:dicarboxylase symporter family transporter [Gemmatimonadales bacterium]|nr:cation:dicarboxylase symporter family transporter [Gemmatimonadales bacterium]
MKENTRVFAALAVALAGGIAIGASGNASLVHAADAIAPIGAMWVNAIRMTVIPLVVSLLITGVASAADIRSIGRLGGRTLVTFVLLGAASAVLVVPLVPLLFKALPAGARPPIPAGAAEAAGLLASGGQTQTLGTWLVSLIPPNPVAAAASGAMVPLILFTLLLAVAIVQSAPQTRDTLAGFFTALGDAMLRIVRWVVLVAPIGVFALVLPVAAHAGAGVAGAIGFYIAVYAGGSMVLMLLLYPLVAAVAGVPMRRFARAALPSQLIAFSSSSSIASLPALIESGEVGLGLSPSVTGFVLPLAVSTFKLAGPIAWTTGALFVGWFYGVPLSTGDLLLIAFAAIFLSFAAPGVPRGAFIMLAPLFAAVHLPIEGIGILIAVDAIPDTFVTVFNVTGDLAAAAIVAGRQEAAAR